MSPDYRYDDTWVWLGDLGRKYWRVVDLATVPEVVLGVAYLMSVDQAQQSP
jgi:hypothetical protein